MILSTIKPSDIDFIKSVLADIVSKPFKVTINDCSNVITVENSKDAKIVLNALYVLNYRTVLHNPDNKIFDNVY